jgi:hypothetical protein
VALAVHRALQVAPLGLVGANLEACRPFQINGVYGDRTVKITVFNRPPDGGTSNSVSLRVQAKWLRGQVGADTGRGR